MGGSTGLSSSLSASRAVRTLTVRYQGPYNSRVTEDGTDMVAEDVNSEMWGKRCSSPSRTLFSVPNNQVINTGRSKDKRTYVFQVEDAGIGHTSGTML